jgi:hypothetical protein
MWILIALACWLAVATVVLAVGRASALVGDYECPVGRRLEGV